MGPECELHFAPFRLDLDGELLWSGAERVPLRPMAFRLLRYLAEHSQRLVTHEELLKAVWQRSYVSDSLMRGYIRELRRALGDPAQAPKFIETVNRRGYRFLAPVTRRAIPDEFQSPLNSRFVGRAAELARLRGALARMRAGERQVVFVTGEPGIGKTALVDVFLAEIGRDPELQITRGQCVEQYGRGEPYLPLFDALGILARGAKGGEFIGHLRRQAPTWLVQVPAFVEEPEREALSRQMFGATQERMAREMVGALEALSAEAPLVLWLEDLHWSDPSTLDIVSLLARRREPARLLLVGTYRPAEAIVRAHPLRALKQELQGHGQCAELPLGFLSLAEVTEYLAPILGDAAPLDIWAQVIQRHSDGNPLFMVAMVEELIAQGAGPENLAGRELPASLRQFLEHLIERLNPEEERLLETAGIAGMEFSPACVAAVLETELPEVEARCEALVSRQHFLEAPAGYRGAERRVTERYRFRHALYRNVLAQRLPASRRRRLHRSVGEWKDRAVGGRAAEFAAELAVHFEFGGDTPRAVHYLGQAAEAALRQAAHREAGEYLAQALALLETLPDTTERTQQEFLLQTSLGAALAMTHGYASPEVETAFRRATVLSRQVGKDSRLFGVCRFYLVRGELRVAYEQSQELLRLAQRAQDAGLLRMAQMMLGVISFFRGEFIQSRAYLEPITGPRNSEPRLSLIVHYGDDREVTRLSHGAWTQWYLGYPDQALESADEAIRLAREFTHPFLVVLALYGAAQLHLYRREDQAALAQGNTLIALAVEYGFPHFVALGLAVRGGALSAQGRTKDGIAEIQRGLAAYLAIGNESGRTYFLTLLSEACGAAGQVEEALKVLDEALAAAHQTGERLYEAEIYRMKGELALRSQVHGRGAEAESCFQQALAVARRQGARSLELRAAMNLARHGEPSRKAEARQCLAEVYAWFTEGFDTKDL